MTQIKEVLEKERNCLERGDLGNIYLFQEGSFYRAYEWSAWLCCRYINPFKVTRREYSAELTNDGTMAFVGFPVTSLGKYVPDAWQVNYMGEKSLSVSLPSAVSSTSLSRFCRISFSVMPQISAYLGFIERSFRLFKSLNTLTFENLLTPVKKANWI